MENDDLNCRWPFPTNGGPQTTSSVEPGSGQAVAALVVPAAELLDVDPSVLAPLYDRVDPDAVNRLLEFFPSGTSDGVRLAIEASWEGVSVLVRDDGTVTTHRPTETPGQLHSLVEREHDWSGSVSLLWSVSRAIVAARDGVTETVPLNAIHEVVETLLEYIDANAFDRVLRPSRSGESASGRLFLSVDGYEMTITSDGVIAIEPSLSVLERAGSALLVVGSVPESGFDRTAAALLGSPERDRTSVFVYHGQDVTTARHRLSMAGYNPASGTVFDCQKATARATATTAGETDPTDQHPAEAATPTVVPLPGGLETIPDAVRDTVAAGGPFEPSQLRVEIDSVHSMLASTSLEMTSKTLGELGRVVRDHQGIGYCHYPVSPDDDSVTSITPLFDGVVELRVGEVDLEQRWRLTATGHETAWFPLE
jgi:hypothetical protein